MTDLSPAAKAVMDAALSMYADCNVRKLAWPLDKPVVAAALRAAANSLREAYANEEYPDHPVDFLFGIAAELNPITTTETTDEN